MKLKLSGVYNHDIIQSARPFGLKSISFDLRPKSFNFTQKHIIEGLINQNSELESFNLMFSGQPVDTGLELLEQLSQKVSIEKKRLKIELYSSDLNEVLSYLDKSPFKVIWHFTPQANYRKVLTNSHLEGVILSQSYLEGLVKSGELYSFLGELKGLNPKLKFYLKLDWDEEFLGSYLDFFAWEGVDFEISSKVEHDYRVLDSSLIINHLKHFSLLFENEGSHSL